MLERAAMEKLRTWASSLDPDPQHSSHVAELSLQLYDGLSQCGIFTLGPEYRRILEAAALLHQVGRSKAKEGHHKRSHRMICKLRPPLGWNAEEMRWVAVAVRYYRGTLPQNGSSWFVGLNSRRRAELIAVIGMLRLADALDDAHDHSISKLVIESHAGAVILYGDGLQRPQEISPRGERIARARYLLETACDKAIMPRPLPAKISAASNPAHLGHRAMAISASEPS
jgi:exopolyphosphatase/pppGpp-phosphohydrolase